MALNINISVGGKFHAFDLARQINKQGYLNKIFTTYPQQEVKKYGIKKKSIKTKVELEILSRGWRRMPSIFQSIWNPQYFVCEKFDKWVARNMKNPNISVMWSSYGLHTIRKAKSRGIVTVLERGSSHIEYQTEILKREYKNFGVQTRLAHPKIIEKELKEYEEVDYISVPSSFVKETFLNKGIPESKLIHIPYGVDLSKFKQISKKDDIFRVIFVGGMSVRKGVHYLIQAFAELDLPNSELLLIGGMNEEIKPFFKEYEGRYKYIGKVPQIELYKYMSNSSVFSMMSLEEGLALVIPQAMACGLPVIATINTGAGDVVRNGKDGFIISVRDIEALKEKLQFLYENPEIRDKMSQSAKERVSSGFTWDDYGEKMASEYLRIIKKHERS